MNKQQNQSLPKQIIKNILVSKISVENSPLKGPGKCITYLDGHLYCHAVQNNSNDPLLMAPIKSNDITSIFSIRNLFSKKLK